MNDARPISIWAPLAVYIIVVMCILGGGGWFVFTHQDDLRLALLEFFLPESWFIVGDALIDRLLDPQALAVLINALVATVFVLVSLLTFPLKEWLSARYERQAGCTAGRTPGELSLVAQGIEEGKLALFYAAMLLGVLRLGLSQDTTIRVTSIVLSHMVLILTVAIDFISPTIARHGLRYAQVLKLLFMRPMRTALFGLIFAAPPVLVGYLYKTLQWSPVMGYGVMAIVQLTTIVAAVLAGTVIGARWLQSLEQSPKVGIGTRVGGWSLVLSLLVYNGLFFGTAAQAAYHVSPVLKCEWTLSADGFDIEPPSLSNPSLGLSLTVHIRNPTERRAKIGDNRVEVRHQGALLATSAFPAFEVDSGAEATQTLAIRVHPKGGILEAGLRTMNAVRKGGIWNAVKGAADPAAYRVTLVLPTPTGEFSLDLMGKKGAR